MKKKNIIVAAMIAFAVLCIAILVMLLGSRQHYAKKCLYDNQETFEEIIEYARKQYHKGDTDKVIHINDDDAFITEHLQGLQDQYQEHSDFPVFSSVGIRYDNEGDIAVSLCAVNKKIRNADGYNTRDMHCYDLVYIDDDYDEEMPAKSKKPFYGNWRIYSYTAFHG